MISIKDTAKNNLKIKKSNAEKIADSNLDHILLDEDIKKLYVECKALSIDIAKQNYKKQDSTKLVEKYNATKLKIQKIVKKKGIDLSIIKPNYACIKCKDTGTINGKDCEYVWSKYGYTTFF